MKGFFSPDSPVARFVNSLGELVILNLCYLICCLPIVTIGAANAALYGTCFRFGTDQQENPSVVFFRLFLSSLKTGTALWFLLLAFLAGTAVSAWMLFCCSGWLHYGWIPLLVLLVFTLMTAWYAFAAVGLFDNGVIGSLANGAVLCLGYLPQSVLILLVNGLPAIVGVAAPQFFVWGTWLWTLLYFALAGRVCTRLASRAFAPYLPWQSLNESVDET